MGGAPDGVHCSTPHDPIAQAAAGGHRSAHRLQVVHYLVLVQEGLWHVHYRE